MPEEENMFTEVLETGLTYGQAMDACIHEKEKVTRSIWGGYWKLTETSETTVPIILATLKNGAGVVPATAYIEDKLATDWMIVR